MTIVFRAANNFLYIQIKTVMKLSGNLFHFGLSVFLFSFITIAGCSKDTGSSAQEKSYLRFKADGVQEEFSDCNVVFMGIMPSVTPTVYYCHITCGVTEDWSALSIYTTNPITKNLTYTEEVNSVTGIPIAGFATKNNDEGEYISWQGGWPYYEVSITLTEVTDKYIKGNFSGKIRQLTGTGIQTITDGEFKADIPQ
jgi:hypothetical protein